MRSKYRLIVPLFVVLLVSLWFGARVDSSSAQAGEAYELIDAVNALRAANGLPPYRINAALMSSAQGHSDYQAAVGTITHTGAGGMHPIDRARAAGYGGGATIFISENIAGGIGFDVGDVIIMWQGDDLHLNTMLGPNYTDIGAGVATDGTKTYYTIDVGYVSGQAGSGAVNPPQATPSSEENSDENNTSQEVALIMPIVVSSPREDGSIVHVVEPGQFLYPIAQAYQVPVQDILQLNNLTLESIIRPGDELLIKAADKTPDPTETIEADPQSTQTPKIEGKIATVQPTTRHEFTLEATATREPSPQPTSIVENKPDSGSRGTVILILGAIISLGTAALVLLWAARRSA